ncbi:VOC family protein [Paenibacillus silvae]|jgi:catechol 2,3-dioxygenase-like lactoylglutathione lyase family enzyme|uniref:VOC family protein n=1 Tax=Paenibacillus silvae TaxID=1325358 RepID=UPI0025A01C70|nr:VOC family protein [Paenibacillus silvae]MDM5280244.1 VOC family protein [Paenibacillus silvae]
MRIKEVNLFTDQIEAMKEFYGTLLELALLEESTSSVSFRAGDSILGLQEASGQEKPFYHVAFTIPTNKLAEAKKWIQARNISLLCKDDKDDFYFPYWDATACYFYDPSGNLMELIAHHSLENAVEDAFDSRQLLCISEIGLPVDDVPDTISQMKGQYHLEPFAGDGKQFAPIGDAEGMFIVIDKEKKAWFPDGRMPGVFATEVKVATGQTGSISLQNGLYSIVSI